MINGYSIGDFSRNIAYEANRNLVSVISNAYTNVSLSRFAYTNDAAGRRTNREDSGSAFASTQANSFGYNANSEVTSANMRNGTSSYTFDQIGNRIQVSVPDEPNPLDYSTNALNQYTAISGAAVSTPLFDPDGNLTNDGKGSTFEWNAENRMVRITTPTKVIENTYDGQGRRVRKVVFDSTLQTLTSDIRYFYDGWNLIYEDDILANTDTKYYVWGLDLSQSLQGAGGVGGLLLVKQGTNTWAPTYDANGNISEYIDLADGSVTAHQEYDAFGRKIVATGTAPSTFGFSTKYEDVETGYLYYGFRFFDPVTGRWPNRDPIGELGGFNLYGFVGNDGVNLWDFLGFLSKKEWLDKALKQALDGSGINDTSAEGVYNETKWENNKVILAHIYNYYGELYDKDNRMEWAGMAKLAANIIYPGISETPGKLERFQLAMTQMAKDVFFDMAWQHLAYADGGLQELKERLNDGELAQEIYNAWVKIDKGDKSGCLVILKYEQEIVLTPGFSSLKNEHPNLSPLLSMGVVNPFSTHVIEDYLTDGVYDGGSIGSKFRPGVSRVPRIDSFYAWTTDEGRRTGKYYDPDYTNFVNRWRFQENVLIPSWNNMSQELKAKAVFYEIKIAD